MPTPATAQTFAREWAAAWNTRDLDRILPHYADDLEFSSPLIASVTGEGSGVLHGKPAVAAYWRRALERFPDLHFQVLDVCAGADSVCIRYRSVMDITAMEVMWFDSAGKVRKGAAHYATLDPQEAASHRCPFYAANVTPILNVSDLAGSFRWFEKLGWRRCWEWAPEPGRPASFGAVGAGQCEIFLCRDGQGGRGRSALARTSGPGGDDSADRGVWMSVWVDDVDGVHARCLEHGLEVTWPPTDEPWGVREMHIRHPDGHVLRISEAREGG